MLGEFDLVGVLDAALGVVGGVPAAADPHLEYLGVGFVGRVIVILVHALGVPEADGSVHPGVFAFRQALGLLFPGDVDAGEILHVRNGVVRGVAGDIGTGILPSPEGSRLRLGLRLRVRVRLGLGIVLGLHGNPAAGGVSAVPGGDGDARVARGDGRDEAFRIHGGGRFVVGRPFHLPDSSISRGDGRFQLQGFADLQGGRDRRDGHARHGDGFLHDPVRFTGHARKSERDNRQKADISDIHNLTGFS